MSQDKTETKSHQAIEAEVTVLNEDEEENSEVFEMASKSKTWSESEKPSTSGSRRQSLLERMRSSKSKSKESTSEEEDDQEEEEEKDEIKPLEDEGQRKRKKGAEVIKRPSFQKQTSRYEDRLRNEDLAVQAAYEKRKESRKLSQKKASKQVKQFIQPTQEEAYDFFTKVDWGPETEVKKQQNQEQSEEEEDEKGEGSGDNDKKKLLPASHYIGEKYLWEMTEKSEPQLDNKTNDQVFIVPTSKIDIESKLGQDQQPRFLEDEGMYIGQAPNVSKGKNQNKMEHRILMEQNCQGFNESKWFASDGKLIAMPNPLRKKPTRPVDLNEDLPANDPLTYYCQPTLPGPDGLPMPVNPSKIPSFSQCQLEVDLSSIVFEHHHLFSLEHYLTNKLSTAFLAYTKIKTAIASKDLDKRLDVIYQSIDDLKCKETNWTNEEKDFQARRLETYRNEIKTMRAERDADCKEERTLTRSILELWKEIRVLRNTQGYQNTQCKIVIKKESVNVAADKKKWSHELKRELEFAREEHLSNYDQLLAKYETDIETWKDVHNKRKEARKRQKQRQRDADKGSGSADANEMADDEALLAEPESKKPEPPQTFDEESTRNALEKHALECRRPPGEPKLHLEWMNSGGNGSNSDTHDNRELNRRNALSKTKIFTKIFFNGKEVCTSSSKSLSSDFVIQVGQIFPIQIVQLPEHLKLQIIEGGTLKTVVLAEVKLQLCEPSKTLADCSLEPIEFKSDVKVAHDHSGLGSGNTFSINLEGSEIDQEFTKGKIFARVGWARGPNGVIMAPSSDQWRPRKDSKMDPLKEVMEPDGKIDPIKLEEWIAKARLDPNDPENEELLARVNEARRRLEMSSSSSVGGASKSTNLLNTGYFRLDQHQDQLIFCTDAEIQNNARFQMIQLRRAKVPEFKNYRMIPILDKEVPKGLLEARTKKALAKGREVMDRGDPLRGRSRLYLEQLRVQVNHRFSLARHRRRHGDVVIEDPLPSVGTLMILCGEMVPAQRPLKPTRIERKKVLMQDVTGKDIKILLSVVRAYDVPVRSDQDPMINPPTGAGPITREGLEESSVYSYIEAQFQDQVIRTSVAVGPNPAWNQELTLIFKSINNDYSPETLNRVKDCLHLHLFDEVTIDLADDDGDKEIHQRVEKKWLGSLTIPFSSLYRNTRIEGTFKLHSPPVLLGYERSGIVGGVAMQSEGALGQGTTKNAKNATFLNIYVTLQPPLIVPDPVKEKLDCDEPESVVQHCLYWSEDLNSRFPERKINPLVADVTGKSVLMTRYFRSIKPPTELFENVEHKSLSIAWFVSLIPYLPNNALFPGLQDIWPTSDQVVHMMVGSEIEHALLLCNFFTGIGKKAFLVFGKGVPEGDTAYVLTVEESGEQRLWNAMSGEHYSVTETFCPLESVHAIANESNLWANIQLSDKPARLRWDLSQTSDWTALFSGNVANPGLPSIQPNELAISLSDHRAAKQLKERIERSLRDTLMHLRKKMNQRTTMNFQGNAILRKLLPSLEASKGGSNTELASEHLNELQRIMTSHKICGFPLHFAFSDIDQLSEALTATGVHLNREDGVEFALAVHVEPYPCTAMSVWIYVASMVRRR